MTSSGAFSVYSVLLVLFTSLIFRGSHCVVTVMIENVTAYSATMLWTLTPIPLYTNITGFNLTNKGVHSMNMINIISDVSARTYNLDNLDDMRSYNACVKTLVPVSEMSEFGCAKFTTPMGTSTAVAIAAGVFLVICLVTFAILDFVVSKSRNRMMDHKREELLERGWQTFERHSKKEKKKAPRPKSVNDLTDVAPSTDVADLPRL